VGILEDQDGRAMVAGEFLERGLEETAALAAAQELSDSVTQVGRDVN
jgi:hypothetical protein